MRPLHQRLSLCTDSNDAYIFVPAESERGPSLTIYRNSGEISLNRSNAPLPSTIQRSPASIYGILGIISLSLSEYVILITGCEPRGCLMGHDIYHATDFDILAVNPNISAQHPPHPVEAHLLALVRSHLRSGSFLFSYSWDLTRRLQVQWDTREQDQEKALWEVADDQFFWNRFLHSRLIESTGDELKQDLSPYILPVMYGTFDVRSGSIHGRQFDLALISRRSRYRAGTRYFRRGVDQEGHVANFIETEQLLLVKKSQASEASLDDYETKMSFAQIRGSVPVYWAEVNTLRYKPDLQIMDLPDTPDSMRKHLQTQVSRYGKTVLVNLVNQKGREKAIKDAFERNVELLNLPDVRYEYFDFHAECKHMRYDRLDLLIGNLQDDLRNQGYFAIGSTVSPPAKQQRGVVRTNCMDTLDRTNVVQSTLAKYTLTQQLQSLDILPETESVDDFETLSQDFRNIWAEHGDLIAKAYSGSGALKSDFTRLNKRTKKGMLQDGYKGALRYLKNNHFDGPRQDAFDLVTGAWVPRKGPVASIFLLADNRPLIIRSVPYVTSFSLFMICAGLTLPRFSDYSLYYYYIFWFTLLSISLIFIFIHGIEYVSWPRLIPLNNIVNYEGPGYRSGNHGKGILGSTQIIAKRSASANSVRKRPHSYLEEIEMGTKKRMD